METRTLAVINDSSHPIGEVTIQIERYGRYNRPYRVTVVDCDPPSLGQGKPDHLVYFEGKWVGPPTPEKLERWANTPPHPVCPQCSRANQLGYNYEGDHASCWTRDKAGDIQTCWAGPVTELHEDPKALSPVAAISFGGSIWG
jgi:hypothetical protein